MKLDPATIATIMATPGVTVRQCGALVPVQVAREPADDRKPVLLPASFTEPARWVIPLLVKCGDNQRDHRRRIGRAGHERNVTCRTLARQLRVVAGFQEWLDTGGSVVVTLTRLSPRTMDSDGVAAACKYVRDAVALLCGVDDGDSRWCWMYGQELAAGHGVRVTMETR